MACAASTAMDKKFHNLAAALALKGFALRRDHSGALLITRRGMYRDLRDLDDAERFARQVGATV